MDWSPHNAIEAYLQTLHMCKANNVDSGNKRMVIDDKKQSHIEPQGLELVSALAAGNQAKLIVQVTNSKQGVTPLTVALAVAAKQTGGKLVCVLPSHEQLKLAKHKDNLLACGLEEHVINDNNRGQRSNDTADNVFNTRSVTPELRVGDPCEKIKDLQNVDFVVIDCGFDTKRLRSFFEGIHLNPKGAIVVGDNIVHREQGKAFIDQVLGGKRGIESHVTIIPLGSHGVQVIIRIKSVVNKPQRRRHKRFLVTFDG